MSATHGRHKNELFILRNWLILQLDFAISKPFWILIGDIIFLLVCSRENAAGSLSAFMNPPLSVCLDYGIILAASAALMGFAGVKRWNVLKWFPHSPNLTELTRKDTEERKCLSEYVLTKGHRTHMVAAAKSRLVKWKMMQTLNIQITLKIMLHVCFPSLFDAVFLADLYCSLLLHYMYQYLYFPFHYKEFCSMFTLFFIYLKLINNKDNWSIDPFRVGG